MMPKAVIGLGLCLLSRHPGYPTNKAGRYTTISLTCCKNRSRGRNSSGVGPNEAGPVESVLPERYDTALSC